MLSSLNTVLIQYISHQHLHTLYSACAVKQADRRSAKLGTGLGFVETGKMDDKRTGRIEKLTEMQQSILKFTKNHKFHGKAFLTENGQFHGM